MPTRNNTVLQRNRELPHCWRSPGRVECWVLFKVLFVTVLRVSYFIQRFRIGFRCVISCVGVNRCCFQAVISSIIVGQFEPDVERRTPYYSWKAEPQFLLSVFVNKWRALTACHRGEIKPLRISIMFCIITYYDGLTTNETANERET